MSINWREKIPKEFLYPNKDWFKRNKQEVPEETPENIGKLEDNQLLIKLGGIKAVAKERGYDSVTYQVIRADIDHVVVKCRIQWSDNQVPVGDGVTYKHHPMQVFEGIGAAHRGNTDSFMVNFLEASAENRAFVRAVRNYLGINIVGEDEIVRGKTNKEEEKEKSAEQPNPLSSLLKVLKVKNILTIDQLKEELRKKHAEDKLPVELIESIKTWGDSFDDISVKDCKLVLGFIRAS